MDPHVDFQVVGVGELSLTQLARELVVFMHCANVHVQSRPSGINFAALGALAVLVFFSNRFPSRLRSFSRCVTLW